MRITLTAAVVALTFLGTMAAVAADAQANREQIYGTAPRDDSGAAAAFRDDRHRHTMNVRRGPTGEGVDAVKCSACHQEFNVEGQHTPPGAPDWRLPPPSMPMIWEGLTDRQLCELFKDPKQNGGRDVDEIVEHVQTPLVLWGWHPGDGRTPVPLPQPTFLADIKQWAAKGAACPGEVAPKPGGGSHHSAVRITR